MKIRIKLTYLLCLLLLATISNAQHVRERELIDNNWHFSYGDAANMEKDFTHGTEYFTYLAKAQAHNQNRGPIWTEFDDKDWSIVNLPHDWVVDLPFSNNASHSHGYKTIGWKYPATSVGWYRKNFIMPESDLGKNIYVQFDGIFRNAQIFCNGFYLGHELSGYTTQVYNLTEYLNYGGNNIITVRVDASTEEGWYYEGAGIYRHVWLNKTAKLNIAPFGTYVTCNFTNNYKNACVYVETTIDNDELMTETFEIVQTIIDNQGAEVAKSGKVKKSIAPKTELVIKQEIQLKNPHLWDLDNPYLYTIKTEVYQNDRIVDSYQTITGFRSIVFDADKGFLLNGKQVKLKGTNLHHDHAGVGVAIPDELWVYRISKLKEIGSNAIRCSHNPASPSMLELCDKMGMLVIDENRLMGTNTEHYNLLKRMIKRDRNHPSVILWSIGNEEWAIENSQSGLRIAESMTAYVHSLDSTRPTTAGIAGGTILLKGADIKGYNYIVQNKVEEFRKEHPDWKAIGTEETTGCGTRGIYFTDKENGVMAPINRKNIDGTVNVIERGWKYYDERPWLGGVFYWTGFDYRGEPNPLGFPATGSQFGIFDYCGFPKDEAFYLKAWWKEEPVLHISPNWNLKKHEGDSIQIFIYSNCDEVELNVNGKKLGRKEMPKNGHLSWNTIYHSGKVVAYGYKDGKKTIVKKIETSDVASKITITPHKTQLLADGQDLVVLDITLFDKNNLEVFNAMNNMRVTVDGPGFILGYGNGNPAFKEKERPLMNKKQFTIKAFNGKAQVLIQGDNNQSGDITITISGDGLESQSTVVHIANI